MLTQSGSSLFLAALMTSTLASKESDDGIMNNGQQPGNRPRSLRSGPWCSKLIASESTRECKSGGTIQENSETEITFEELSGSVGVVCTLRKIQERAETCPRVIVPVR